MALFGLFGKKREKNGTIISDALVSDFMHDINSEPSIEKNQRENARERETGSVEEDIDISGSDELWEPTPYYAPPISCLHKQPIAQDTTLEDEETAREIESCLASFGVRTRTVAVDHGPNKIQYSIELAPGTKVSKVENLNRELCLALGVREIEIEPSERSGSLAIGVPGEQPEIIYLRMLLESQQLQNAKSVLSIPLGLDKYGKPIVCSLDDLHHLLIAGQTGSGKTTLLSSILTSMLYRVSPEEAKLILICNNPYSFDMFNGCPHLMLPVISNGKQAEAALSFIKYEIVERKRLFSACGVRSIYDYNNMLEPGKKPTTSIIVVIDDIDDVISDDNLESKQLLAEIVSVGSSCGIHLIITSQSGSADVLGTNLKNNIPSRIAMRTGSHQASQMIIDQSGAEKLRFAGEMLFYPKGALKPVWVKGSYISDEELIQVTDHVKMANPSSYDPDVLDKLEALVNNRTPTDTEKENPQEALVEAELFEQAVDIAIADGQLSTSTLQRRLRIGYARAGHILDQMEARGIVPPKDGSKPRKCLITKEQWESWKCQ